MGSLGFLVSQTGEEGHLYLTRLLRAWLLFFVEVLNVRGYWHIREKGKHPILGGLGTKNKRERNIFIPVGANCSRRNRHSLMFAPRSAGRQ